MNSNDNDKDAPLTQKKKISLQDAIRQKLNNKQQQKQSFGGNSPNTMKMNMKNQVSKKPTMMRRKSGGS